VIHISSPFCSGYFGDGGLMNYLPRLALNFDSPSLSFPNSSDYRQELLMPSRLKEFCRKLV
jgi:hypothetical protein